MELTTNRRTKTTKRTKHKKRIAFRKIDCITSHFDSSSFKMAEEIKANEVGFKMPSLPSSGPLNPSKISSEEEEKAQVKKPLKSPAEVLKERTEPPLQYIEPEWAGIVPSDKNYYIEELKNGTIVKTYKLKDKSYYSIGRLPSNDIEMEHPSLSRYHAIIQYKEKGSPDQPEGFYLYDLGSTHGKIIMLDTL